METKIFIIFRLDVTILPHNAYVGVLQETVYNCIYLILHFAVNESIH